MTDFWNYHEATAKVVNKPWGKEVWINYRKDEQVGDQVKPYVMKKLYIRAGTRTSFQYHVEKVETNFLLEGMVEAWFESSPGYIDKQVLTAGAIWTIPAGIKHRIITKTDVILVETSTPEVDDVIRIEDDTLRGDGRIPGEHESE